MRTRQVLSSSNLMSSDDISMSAKKIHTTVLLHEAVDALRIQPNSIVLDATVGATGHAQEIIRLLDERGTYIGVDAD